MLKSYTALEHKIGERTYEFFCAPDSSLGEVHDALIAFRNHVVQKIVEAQETEKKQQQQAIAKEEVVESQEQEG